MFVHRSVGKYLLFSMPHSYRLSKNNWHEIFGLILEPSARFGTFVTCEHAHRVFYPDEMVREAASTTG